MTRYTPVRGFQERIAQLERENNEQHNLIIQLRERLDEYAMKLAECKRKAKGMRG